MSDAPATETTPAAAAPKVAHKKATAPKRRAKAKIKPRPASIHKRPKAKRKAAKRRKYPKHFAGKVRSREGKAAFVPISRKAKPTPAAVRVLKAVRAYKLKNKLTDDALGVKLGINRATLYGWARGDSSPSDATIARLRAKRVIK